MRAKKVVVIDDDRTDQASMKGFLLHLNHKLHVVTYAIAPYLIEKLKEGQKFDLVVIDGHLMDGYTGPCYARYIKKNWPEIIVVGWSDEPPLTDQFKLSADYTVVKDINHENAARMIVDILEGKIVLSQ